MTSPAVRYVPGSAIAIVQERTAVLLDMPGDDPLVARIVAVVQSGAGVDDVLDALVSSGLKNLADFGAFEVRPDGVRLVVRGSVIGSVGALAGINAEHTMWHDTWQPRASTAGLAMAPPESAPRLPIASGVVLASALTFGETELPVPTVVSGTAAPAASPVSPPAVAAPVAGALIEPELDPDLIAIQPEPGLAQPEPEAIEPGLVDSAPVTQPQEAEPPSAVTEPAGDDAAGGDDYAHLFGATLRPSELAEAEPAPQPEPTAVTTPPAIDPGATMVAPLTIPAAELAAAVEPAPAVAPSPGLITGMPWLSESAETEPPIAPVVPAAPVAAVASVVPVVDAPLPSESGAAAGMVTPPQAAPVVSPAVDVAGSPESAVLGEPSVPDPGSDRTINRSALVGLTPTVMVVAARCPQGHPSPAYAGTCRVCGAVLPAQQPVEIPRPSLGQLRLSTGGVVPLDRPVILGRNPRIPAGYAAEQPNLVRLPDPGKDVSGQHLEVSLDYWNVVVRDLGSTNGTEVILPGEMPVALRANDPVIIEPGTRVVLAGVITFTFEVLP